MPASARKSSIGSRRQPQKYIPYRADDLHHGKKTGMAVAYVDHRSDEFEPFEKVMSQADQRTPPRVQNARKKRTPKPKTPVLQTHVEDEDGEMSMELEDSECSPTPSVAARTYAPASRGYPYSPTEYFANQRVNTITSSVRRVGSSSRPVAQGSDVDFDKVPSPRPSMSSRRSLGLPRSPGRSQLSQSTVALDNDDFPDEPDMDYGGGSDLNGAGFDSDDDDNNISPLSARQEQQQSAKKLNGRLSRRASFAQIDQDEEDELQLTRSPSTSKARGKQRASYEPHQDIDAEEDMVQFEVDVEQDAAEEEEVASRKRSGPERGEDDSIEKQQPASKKARFENEGAKKPRGRPGGKKVQVLRELTPEDPNENQSGLRRGKRTRYKPLDWWRCEKVVYGRRETGKSLVPAIKEIRRIPKEESQPLGAKHRRKRPPRSKSKTAEESDKNLVFNPEEGWDDETPTDGFVLDYNHDEEIKKRIAFTAKDVEPKPAANNEFFFQKIFWDGDFIAAGQLIIPPNKQKPTKGTKDNTFVFYVIEGAVNFTVHQTSFVLTTGGMFLVPRGNMYFIQNISDRDAKLFFAQARKMVDDDDEELHRVEDAIRGRSQSLKVPKGSPQARQSAARSPSARASSEARPPPTTAAGKAALKRAASAKT
ncbi:uncharacterized protein FIBRA_08703 [Fibroporia radiculosa]|uniref:CENP-C homolog n=1 Tax=Fibroporia radiculosa TaxID=599839 RepID=J4ICH9_9APHY|nr:uncharacterized protein FIBRA_08703 [Fibroporia radiculosa]CCM06441.1 predicted protein [Fibroporia radiculosa]